MTGCAERLLFDNSRERAWKADSGGKKPYATRDIIDPLHMKVHKADGVCHTV